MNHFFLLKYINPKLMRIIIIIFTGFNFIEGLINFKTLTNLFSNIYLILSIFLITSYLFILKNEWNKSLNKFALLLYLVSLFSREIYLLLITNWNISLFILLFFILLLFIFNNKSLKAIEDFLSLFDPKLVFLFFIFFNSAILYYLLFNYTKINNLTIESLDKFSSPYEIAVQFLIQTLMIPIVEEFQFRNSIKKNNEISLFQLSISYSALLYSFILTSHTLLTLTKILSIENNLADSFSNNLHYLSTWIIDFIDIIYINIEFIRGLSFLPKSLFNFIVLTIIIYIVLLISKAKKEKNYNILYKFTPLLSTLFVYLHFTTNLIDDFLRFENRFKLFAILNLRLLQLTILTLFLIYFRRKFNLLFVISLHSIFNLVSLFITNAYFIKTENQFTLYFIFSILFFINLGVSFSLIRINSFKKN
jgi:hypothetical protein